MAVTPLLGYKPNPKNVISGPSVRSMLRKYELEVAHDYPESWSLSEFAYDPIEQRGSSCVGASAAHAVIVGARCMGHELDVSYLAIYAGARHLEYPKLTSLYDNGTYPYLAALFMRSFGVCARERWPEMSDVNELVPFDVLMAGHLATVESYEILDSSRGAEADNIKDDICSAVYSGHPVQFGMMVDESYYYGPGLIYKGKSSPDVGGHAQTVIGYDEQGVTVLNSWGTSWNGNGTAKIAWDFVVSGCSDFTVYHSLPSVAL